MPDMPDVSSIAALLGDPTRARILASLMDGRARTATELALEGGVSPSTTSSHLARLTEAGLLDVVPQGRHRYFRVASPEVASAIEGLMALASRRGRRAPVPPAASDWALRRARVCYDHLAGDAGVRLLEGLRGQGLITGDDQVLSLTPRGEMWSARMGIDLTALRARRRPLCRACLDWSERRMHLAGALGAAVLDRLFELRWARRERGSRAIILSARGERFVEHLEPAR